MSNAAVAARTCPVYAYLPPGSAVSFSGAMDVPLGFGIFGERDEGLQPLRREADRRHRPGAGGPDRPTPAGEGGCEHPGAAGQRRHPGPPVGVRTRTGRAVFVSAHCRSRARGRGSGGGTSTALALEEAHPRAAAGLGCGGGAGRSGEGCRGHAPGREQVSGRKRSVSRPVRWVSVRGRR
jgi:hypothetical protein